MSLRPLLLLSLSALALGVGATARTSANTDPHGHAAKARTALGAVDPMAPVYIVTSRRTFDAGIDTLATQPKAARDSVGRDLVVSRVLAHQLDNVSSLIHEKERRCGGYFAFPTEAEAFQFLRKDRTAKAVDAKALPAYTIDNPVQVNAWMAQVRESRIRDTIVRLSTNYDNRYYANTSGQQAAQWIKSTWSGLGQGRPDVSVSYESCSNCGVQPSVVMTVRGSSLPDEIVVVGAHLDSISDAFVGGVMRAPGADDDASGIATLTEVIRIALAQGWRPQRTVKFMGYAAEEVGLRGSRSIADEHRADNANVVGVLQLDMTNYAAGSTHSMRLVTDFSNATLQQFVTRLFDTYLAPQGLTRGVYACGYACSDHASWTAAGYPSAFMFEPTLFPHLHTPDDTMANIGPTAQVSVNFAKLALAFVGELGKSTVDAPMDFNHDGRSDVFWRNAATGGNDVWLSANATTRQPTYTVPVLAWEVKGIGDFNGDGRDDVLWRNSTTGGNDIWLSASSSSRRPIAALADTGWKIAGVGDFGNRGAADIFWRHATTGQNQVWVGGVASAAQSRATVASASWQIVGVGDFDGDHYDDVLWRNSVSGANELWRWGDSTRRLGLTPVTDLAWRVAGVADFNADGKEDILWRNASTGANVIWHSASSGGQRVLPAVATAWEVAGTGDYTGDGRGDIFWRHASLGYNDLWPGANSNQRVQLARVSNMAWHVVP